MSSDLLAEFDSFYTGPGSKQTGTTSASNDISFLSNGNHTGSAAPLSGASKWQTSTTTTNDDIWGDLSTFQPSSSQQPKPLNHQDPWASFEAALPDVTPAKILPQSQVNYGGTTIRAGIVRRPTIDLFSPHISDRDGPSTITNTKFHNVPPPISNPTRQSSSGGDILFDAADELAEDDDDFGDFETVTSTGPPPPPSDTLFDFFASPAPHPETKSSKRPKDIAPIPTTLVPSLPYPQAPKSPSFQERNPFAGVVLATAQVSQVKAEDRPQSASPVTAWPNFEPPTQKHELYQDSPVAQENPEDEWGEFADLAPETPAAISSAKPTSGIEADAWAWDNADKVTEVASPIKSVPPPTNIPPPSVILALFPTLFDLPQATLFKAVANQPFSLKNRIISDPSTIDFLRAYLLIATVAARIIGGRKLRWKRDTLLSQSMKIGPAAAGGKGGMKLTGVDKTEITKEDREAADVVRVWREQIGRLKSAIAIANTSIKDASRHLTIPEINDTMIVKTQEGALTAPKPCVICGLKREERLKGIDLQVEDSFGEWWTEYWGHRACRNFWQEHESKLKHR
jgi:hypothetical protein